LAKRLGEILLEAGLVGKEQLAAALERQERHGGRIGSNLVATQALGERLVVQALSLQQGLPFVVLGASAIPLSVLDGFPVDVARKHSALPIHRDGDELFVVMSDPSRKTARDELGFITGKHIVEHGALRSVLQDVIEEAYALKSAGKARFWEGMDLEPGLDLGENGHLEIVVGRVPSAQSAPSAPEVVSDADLLGLGDDPGWVDDLAQGKVAPQPQGGKQILVVDDEEGIRHMLAAYFSKSGYEVIEAADGQAAMTHMKASLPSAVILDAMLPGVHGFDICRRIKQAEATRHIPVIMISAVYRGWRYADDVRSQYGADGFMEKPLRLDELKHVMEQAMAEAGEAPAPQVLSAQAEHALKQAAAMFRSGDPMGAVHHLRQAIEAAPFDASLHQRLGLLYEQLKENYRAIASLERAVELACKHEFILALAKLYEKTGFTAKAYEAWERCLRMNPDSPEAAEIRQRMEKLLP